MSSETLCFLCGFTSNSPGNADLLSLPGSEGSAQLNDRLILYFLAQKMFQCSKSQTLTILNSLTCQKKSCLETCDQCQAQIAAGLKLHQEVTKLQDQIREAGRILSSRIQDSWEGGGNSQRSENLLARTLRSILCKEISVKSEDSLDYHLETDQEPLEDFEMPPTSPLETDAGAPSYILTPDRNFVCKICSSVYTSIVGIRKHEKKHELSSSLGNVYDCHLCKFPATSDNNLKRHLKAQHSEGDHLESYPCNKCSSVYTSFPGFKKHQDVHKQSDLLGNKYDCPTCNHPTTSRINLSRHLTSVHQVNPFQSELITGRQTKSETEGHYKFDHCLVAFSNPSGHSERAANSEHLRNELNCEPCDDLNDFEEKTAKERPGTSEKAVESGKEGKLLLPDCFIIGNDGVFWCKKCDSKYTTYPGAKKHEKKHGESDAIGNLYDCLICRHPNNSELILRRHMSIVHGVTSIKRLQVKSGKSKIKVEQFQEVPLEIPQDPFEIPEGPNAISEVAEVREETPEARSPEGQDSYREEDDEWLPDEEEVEVKNKPRSKRKSRQSGRPNYDKGLIPELFRRGDGDVWHCSRCESVYTTVPGMKKHVNMHEESDQLGNVFDCEVCRHPNGSDSKLRRHLSKVHGIPKRKRNRTKNEREIVEDLDENEYISEEPYGAVDDEEETKHEESDNYGLYHCSKCNVNYKSQRGFERHEEDHKISIEIGHKFDCSCGFPASTERRLKIHKRLQHSEPLTCYLCQLKVKSEEQLKAHLRWHQPSNKGRVRKRQMRDLPKVFKCDECKLKFTRLGALNSHLKDHEKSGVLYTCKVCRKVFSSYGRLKQHRLEHQRRGVICGICHKQFCSSYARERHERTHKEQDKMRNPVTGLYHCAVCTFIGRSRMSLLAHRSCAHRDVQFEDSSMPHHLCPQCGKNFYSASCLRKHVRNIHENIYKYNCELCGKGFETEEGFSNHKISHIDKTVRQREHICDTCGASYSYKQSLRTHIAKFHTDSVDHPDVIASNPRKFAKVEEHRCKYCEMVFPFKYLLVSHVPSVHPEVYKFPCDQCPRKYTSSSSLRLHKEIVHSGNTFTCEFCQRTIGHKHYAYQHYKCCPAKREQSSSNFCMFN